MQYTFTYTYKMDGSRTCESSGSGSGSALRLLSLSLDGMDGWMSEKRRKGRKGIYITIKYGTDYFTSNALNNQMYIGALVLYKAYEERSKRKHLVSLLAAAAWA